MQAWLVGTIRGLLSQRQLRAWSPAAACLGIYANLLIGDVPPDATLGQEYEPASIETVDWQAHGLLDVSAEASLQPAPLTKPGSADQPFGMDTEPVAGQLAKQWHALEVELDQEQRVLAGCRARQACPGAAQALLDIVADGARHTGLARVGVINRAVDLMIAPLSDAIQWNVEDKWSPPFETLETRRGDCEDYAIVKYLALLETGLSRDDVKIVITRNLRSNEDHAVVAARVNGEWLILDNRYLALVPDRNIVGAVPKFVLDEGGVRRLVPSPANALTAASTSSAAPATYRHR